MELLTFIGQAAKRRESYIDRAQRLAESFPSLEGLEAEMEGRAEALTRKLKANKITLSEFQRASAEDTLVSSVSAVMLGLGETEIPQTLYSEAMGQMKYLWNFFDDIKLSLDNDRLSDEEDYQEEEDDDWYYPVPGEDQPLPVSQDERGLEAPVVSTPTSLVIPLTGARAAKAAIRAAKTTVKDTQKEGKGRKVSPTAKTDTQAEEAQKESKPRQRQRGPATWNGLGARLKRFLVTPLWRWFVTGESSKKRTEGSKEMRRISRHDRRVCEDCKYYDSLGWVPIGSLPMPGVGCKCHDRCRCVIKYR
jgi:hypothetical protein